MKGIGFPVSLARPNLKLGSNGGPSKNFHGVGIGPLSKILAVKVKNVNDRVGYKPIDVVFERPPKDNPCLGAKKVLSCRTKKGGAADGSSEWHMASERIIILSLIKMDL